MSTATNTKDNVSLIEQHLRYGLRCKIRAGALSCRFVVNGGAVRRSNLARRQLLPVLAKAALDAVGGRAFGRGDPQRVRSAPELPLHPGVILCLQLRHDVGMLSRNVVGLRGIRRTVEQLSGRAGLQDAAWLAGPTTVLGW